MTTDVPGNVPLNAGLGAREGLASNMRNPSSQPRFTVKESGRWIDDDDFLFDATIKIGGDFLDADRVRYAQWVCDVLNEADKLLPRQPDDGLGPNIKRMDLGA